MSYVYVCLRCAARFAEDYGRCPQCQEYGSLVSRDRGGDDGDALPGPIRRMTGLAGMAEAARIVGTAMVDAPAIAVPPARAVPLAQISRATGALARLSTGYAEVDRVLGGGIVDGAPILLAGVGGGGKSTVALGIAGHVANQPDHDVIYASGEEMPEKIAHRADRLGIVAERLAIVHETNLEKIVALAEHTVPSLLIIDSIQKIRSERSTSDAGTPHQIRICTDALADFANATKVAVLIIGHVTKDGAIAGPETLKHLVDVVLYLESADEASPVRYLSSSKNRHGDASEIGVLEMTARGMIDGAAVAVIAPAPRAAPTPGSILCPVTLGQRIALVEIEALVGPAREGKSAGEIHSSGIDRARVARIIAILDKHAMVDVTDRNVYVSVAGGLRVVDPAADLAVALAIASSVRELAYAPGLCVAGELALSGEVRAPVPRWEARAAEIDRAGIPAMLSYRTLSLALDELIRKGGQAVVASRAVSSGDFPVPSSPGKPVEFTPPAETTRSEVITAAAVRVGDPVIGYVIYDVPRPGRHHDVLSVMPEYVAVASHPDDQGFVTSAGRFVDRAEAALIARAAGQLIREPTPANMLTSEDVW